MHDFKRNSLQKQQGPNELLNHIPRNSKIALFKVICLAGYALPNLTTNQSTYQNGLRMASERPQNGFRTASERPQKGLRTASEKATEKNGLKTVLQYKNNKICSPHINLRAASGWPHLLRTASEWPQNIRGLIYCI